MFGVALIVVGSASLVLRAGYENLRAASKDKESPRAVLKTTTWDFGDVEPGQILRASIPVTNAGGTRLAVVNESSSCSCSSTTTGGIVVLPGETSQLEVKLDTRGSRSVVQSELRFFTNDPQRPRLTITLLAKVRGR